MADTPQTLSSITNALAQVFPSEVRRQINRKSVLLSILPVVMGSGKNVSWDVKGDGAVAETFTDGADVSNYGSDVPEPATLNWGQYRSNFRITNTAAAAAMTSHSPSELKDLLGGNLWDSVAVLGSTINAALYSGNGSSPNLAGLSLAVDSTGTYAGLDRSSKTFWRSTESDSSSAALTLKQIEDDLAAIEEAGGIRPDIAVCKPSVRNKIKNLFSGQRQFTKEIYSARGKTVLDSSANALIVDECQFIADKDCTSNAIYYLSSEVIHIEVLPQVVSFAPLKPTSDPHFDNLMKAVHAFELGRTGSSRKFSMEAHLQLVVRQPNACGKRINIG